MKKKLIGVVVVAAMVVTAGWNYNQSQNEVGMSDLALANVEALARDEAESNNYKCYSILNGSGQSISCSSCQMAVGTPPWYHFGDKCSRY